MANKLIANYQSIENAVPSLARCEVGRLERLAPSLTLWIALATYVVCRLIATVKQTYVGGIPWPFMR